MTPKFALVLTAALLSNAVLVHAGTEATAAGQKIDSGLGSLPHYSHWVDKTGGDPMGVRVLGESLDNGLGELPHYSTWADKSGRDPMGRERIMLTSVL